jgi:natural product biosynthesis luciferase-like monooxygenase protein
MVASRDPGILEWAGAAGIAAVRIDGDGQFALPDGGFDYLFSIANLRVLPAGLIGRARKLAINFHDGPLPRYAGLNATSWALMAQETTHGVTWHEMTDRVDAGRIVRQARFPVGAEDTALSLNACCYEAGLASFEQIVQDLGRGELPFQEQSGERIYFAAARRPPALGTIDFRRPAGEIAALVRALDFGSYANPLALPKIFLGDRLLVVRSARVLNEQACAAAGTLLRAGADALQVATAQGDIEFAGCSDIVGRPAAQLLAPGTVLPRPADALLQELESRIPGIAAGEVFWREALAQLACAELPYPRLPRAAAQPAQPLRLGLGVPARGAATAAAFSGWLAALTGRERISMSYCDAVLAGQAEGIEPWVSPWVPLSLDTGPRTGVAELRERAETQIGRCRTAGPCPRDLPARLGDKTGWEALGRIALGLVAMPAPHGAELLLTVDASGRDLELVADGAVFSAATLRTIADHLGGYLSAFEAATGELAEVALVPPHEADALQLRGPAAKFDPFCLHEAIAAQAARTPRHAAISHDGETVSYLELDRRASALAARLLERGVAPGDIVGLCLERTPELVIGLLAIMKAGAAYLPLDPDYPGERVRLMIEDSGTRLVVTTAALAESLAIARERTLLLDATGDLPEPSLPLPAVTPDSAAYVIYTSGSTGRPKGVVVTHRNVMNFFAGMDERVPHEDAGRWLAVTSLSFDISVLELCWTLARGFTVVLHSNTVRQPGKPLDFSLFYFANEDSSATRDGYKLLMDGAKFADRAGFSAIWTPERHFHAFGAPYPNPAVTSAAIAAVTTRLKIRAGSCVLPLHHPIRVAEEWAFIDNISQGRVGISFAAGWQPNDFVIAPSAFANRKNDMLAGIDTVRRLWRGESVAFPGPLGKDVEVRTFPRPVQKELPVWVTAAGNPETFRQAGELGCHLLTHLLGQKIEDVADKLAVYRAAWREAGHAGDGHVTLMLHTFVGPDEDEARETVRGPMKAYLRSSMDLIRQAAWTFPTFVQRGAEQGKTPAEIMEAQPLSPEETDALLEHAFSRYYDTSALFGTPERCSAIVAKMKDAGVDEIACLIDFGIDTDTVLAHLQDLKELMDATAAARPTERRVPVADAIMRNDITHLQCTPSMAAMLLAEPGGRDALARVSVLLVGGEALPLQLAHELRALVAGHVINMYGPTETTIWSSTCDLSEMGDFVPLGRPIANTTFSIRTPWGAECPALVPGELLIGGEGVAREYWRRPELTAERFVNGGDGESRLYRTGDLVRRQPDGALEFLGRIDHQVKIRGHRIELGEIESALARQSGVDRAVVVAREHAPGDVRLAAYVTCQPGLPVDPAGLRDALARELPAIMVPATVQLLQALPMTPNGKVDRAALPQPGTEPELAVRTSAAPQTQVEKIVREIWQDVLGRADVGPADNFFDLGGHSLLVVQVQRRLRDTGYEVSITDMFRLPTVRALAAHLGGTAPRSAVREGLERANQRRLMRPHRGAGQRASA